MTEYALPVDPTTLAEWQQLVREYPDSPHLWRPGKQGRKLLGLPDYFGRAPKPLSRAWKNRFIAEIVNDPEFRRASVHALRGVR